MKIKGKFWLKNGAVVEGECPIPDTVLNEFVDAYLDQFQQGADLVAQGIMGKYILDFGRLRVRMDEVAAFEFEVVE